MNIFSLVIILAKKMIWTIFVKRSTTTKMEFYELESAKRFVIKPMGIKGITMPRLVVVERAWRSWWRFLVWAQTSHDPTNFFTNLQSFGHYCALLCWSLQLSLYAHMHIKEMTQNTINGCITSKPKYNSPTHEFKPN